MKVHTTNYENTLIQVAEDCPVEVSEIPPVKGKRSAANIQYDMISKHPYKYTSDDVLFQVYAEKNDLTEKEYKAEREKFFPKGQPCLRCSPLTKRYGWGVHCDTHGKIALIGCETATYKKLSKDKSLTTVKAMRSSRA